MPIRIEVAEDKDALSEFILLYNRVYAARAARWPAFVDFELAVLGSDSPYLRGRTIHPLVARESGEVVARVMAVLDQRYIDHWQEPLGHVVMFEALPGTQAAARALLDRACAWLAERGATAARAGYGMLDLPFAVDDYESLPPTILRQSPPYYHTALKQAGFETEKGWVDYRIAVHPRMIESWQQALKAARRAGFDIVPLREKRRGARATDFARTWNEAFAQHWGHTPTSDDEFLFLIDALRTSGVLDTSAIAYRDGVPVGAVWVVPESASVARVAPGHTLAESERLNTLAIGVCASARGQGVNLALASHAYLELARRGARYLSYTLVLDDNWPSRRTAEKLGGEIRANYISYRRNFRRPAR